MVHTATLICPTITSEEYTAFVARAGKDGVKWYRSTKEAVLELYKDIGVRVSVRKEFSQEYKGYIVVCRVNFHRLVSPLDVAGVYTHGEYEAMRVTFDNIMTVYGLPTLERYIVNRIDYCVNIVTPYAAEYIKLMQKGNKPYNLTIPYDKKNHERCQKEGSVYYHSTAYDKRKKSTGAYTINFYDKYVQKESEGLSGKDLEPYQNILRIEVQCHSPKVDTLKKKFQLWNKSPKLMLSSEISRAVLHEAVLRVAGTGDYYRRAEALSMIEALPCRGATKENIQKIMDEIGIQYGSVWRARQKLVKDTQELKEEQFRNAMNKLKEIGVNPVTIGNSRKVRGLPKRAGLPNVWKLYEEQYGG